MKDNHWKMSSLLGLVNSDFAELGGYSISWSRFNSRENDASNEVGTCDRRDLGSVLESYR